MNQINLKAYAKLNLYLDILGKRPDGYHEVLTKLCLIDLADDVTVTLDARNNVIITCDNPEIPLDCNNTAHKAAELFMREIKLNAGVQITIVKKIPVKAGLGGSSADAAAVLRGLNALAGYPLSFEQLLETAARVGSDVPFCVHGGCAICTGTGTRIARALPLPRSIFVIVKPEFSHSTREAYALYSREYGERGFSEVALPLYNIFERLYGDPRIELIKNEFTALGASGSLMTGSGSAVFGIFDDIIKAQNAFEALDYPEKFIAWAVDYNHP